MTLAPFLILAIQLAVLLPPVPHFLAVLVHLQPVFQLLGAALLLEGLVPFFLLPVQHPPARKIVPLAPCQSPGQMV